MQEVLRPLIAERIATSGDFRLLGFAANRLGNFEEAVWFFEQVRESSLHIQFERILYCNQYAHALLKLGQTETAIAHVQQFDTAKWPGHDREWADSVARSAKPESEPPEQQRPKRRLGH